MRVRQRVPQRPVKPRPRAHHPVELDLMHGAAGAVAAHVSMRGDAKRRDHVEADARHHVAQGIVRAEPGAAPGEVVADALVDLHVPARCAQQVRGEQAAERAADDQRTATLHADLKLTAELAVERAAAGTAYKKIKRDEADQE